MKVNAGTAVERGCADRETTIRLALLSFASILVLAVASEGPARAAETSGPTDSSAAGGSSTLDEVIVTAQKRSEDIKSVPISITALSGQELAEDRIASIDDLSRIAPGVAFTSNGTEGTTNITIRGVSSSAGAATVGLYIDDVSVTTKNLFYEGAVEPHLPDLDRIEVLRGPQGTLYGDSSEGGTIRYLSQQPNVNQYSAEAMGDTSNTYRGGENYSGSFNINMPLVPGVFALRASFSAQQDSGWIDHYTQDLVDYAAVGGGVLDGTGVNSDRILTLHLTGRAELPGGLVITPSLFAQTTYVNDSSAFYLNTPGLGLYDQDKEVQEFGRDSMTLASLNIQKPLGFANFTSVTGLFERRATRQEDGTYFNSTTFADAFLAAIPGACPSVCAPLPNPVNPDITPTDALNIIGNLPSAVHLNTKYVQFTQEFRLSSPDTSPNSPLHWVAGLYYAHQRIHNTDFQQIPGINSTFLNLYGETLEQSSVETAFNGGIPNTTLFPDDIDESDDRTYYETQYSIFGQVDYTPFPTWHIGVGGRVETASEHFESTEIGFYQIGNISPYTQQGKSTSFTPKITLSKDLTPDETIYASAGKGFRLGGPTGPITFGPNTVCAGDFATINQTTQPVSFKSDDLWTYELGSKGRYLDDRLSVNVSAFYTTWHNIQQQIYLPTCGYYFTENVGDARIYGGELEAVYRLTNQLTLNVDASGESATITRSINPIDVPVGSNLINVPVGTINAGGAYRRSIGPVYSLYARLDYQWIGHSYGSYQSLNPNYYNPSYSVVNASIAIQRANYELSLYAKNLLQNHTIIQSPEINTVVEGYTVHPRTIGLTLRAGF